MLADKQEAKGRSRARWPRPNLHPSDRPNLGFAPQPKNGENSGYDRYLIFLL